MRSATSVYKSTDTTIAAYQYDFMGRRVSSTDSSGQTTYFHYDGWNVVAESDNNGQITSQYYYDQSGQIQAMKKSGQTYYYQFNAHGDVVSLTDSSGQIVNEYQYDPWGNHLAASETVSNPYRYAGYRWDSDTGLYYLRARYYSSGIMRFISKDKFTGYIGSPGSFNLYVYARNNPIKHIDPKGNSAADLAIGELEDELDELEKEYEDHKSEWSGWKQIAEPIGDFYMFWPSPETLIPGVKEEWERVKAKKETEHRIIEKQYRIRKKQLEEAILQLKIMRFLGPDIKEYDSVLIPRGIS